MDNNKKFSPSEDLDKSSQRLQENEDQPNQNNQKESRDEANILEKSIENQTKETNNDMIHATSDNLSANFSLPKGTGRRSLLKRNNVYIQKKNKEVDEKQMEKSNVVLLSNKNDESNQNPHEMGLMNHLALEGNSDKATQGLLKDSIKKSFASIHDIEKEVDSQSEKISAKVNGNKSEDKEHSKNEEYDKNHEHVKDCKNEEYDKNPDHVKDCKNEEYDKKDEHTMNQNREEVHTVGKDCNKEEKDHTKDMMEHSKDYRHTKNEENIEDGHSNNPKLTKNEDDTKNKDYTKGDDLTKSKNDDTNEEPTKNEMHVKDEGHAKKNEELTKNEEHKEDEEQTKYNEYTNNEENNKDKEHTENEKQTKDNRHNNIKGNTRDDDHTENMKHNEDDHSKEEELTKNEDNTRDEERNKEVDHTVDEGTTKDENHTVNENTTKDKDHAENYHTVNEITIKDKDCAENENHTINDDSTKDENHRTNRDCTIVEDTSKDEDQARNKDLTKDEENAKDEEYFSVSENRDDESGDGPLIIDDEINEEVKVNNNKIKDINNDVNNSKQGDKIIKGNRGINGSKSFHTDEIVRKNNNKNEYTNEIKTTVECTKSKEEKQANDEKNFLGIISKTSVSANSVVEKNNVISDKEESDINDSNMMKSIKLNDTVTKSSKLGEDINEVRIDDNDDISEVECIQPKESNQKRPCEMENSKLKLQKSKCIIIKNSEILLNKQDTMKSPIKIMTSNNSEKNIGEKIIHDKISIVTSLKDSKKRLRKNDIEKPVSSSSDQGTKKNINNRMNDKQVECVTLSSDSEDESGNDLFVCERCENIWSNKILHKLFLGDEPVTVNSKITYGAIILINKWAHKNWDGDREVLVKSIFERADLGKNVENLQISQMNNWLGGLMKLGKIKCCEVFAEVYKAPDTNVGIKQIKSSQKDTRGRKSNTSSECYKLVPSGGSIVNDYSKGLPDAKLAPPESNNPVVLPSSRISASTLSLIQSTPGVVTIPKGSLSKGVPIQATPGVVTIPKGSLSKSVPIQGTPGVVTIPKGSLSTAGGQIRVIGSGQGTQSTPIRVMQTPEGLQIVPGSSLAGSLAPGSKLILRSPLQLGVPPIAASTPRTNLNQLTKSTSALPIEDESSSSTNLSSKSTSALTETKSSVLADIPSKSTSALLSIDSSVLTNEPSGPTSALLKTDSSVISNEPSKSSLASSPTTASKPLLNLTSESTNRLDLSASTPLENVPTKSITTSVQISKDASLKPGQIKTASNQSNLPLIPPTTESPEKNQDDSTNLGNLNVINPELDVIKTVPPANSKQVVSITRKSIVNAQLDKESDESQVPAPNEHTHNKLFEEKIETLDTNKLLCSSEKESSSEKGYGNCEKSEQSSLSILSKNPEKTSSLKKDSSKSEGNRACELSEVTKSSMNEDPLNAKEISCEKEEMSMIQNVSHKPENSYSSSKELEDNCEKAKESKLSNPSSHPEVMSSLKKIASISDQTEPSELSKMSYSPEKNTVLKEKDEKFVEEESSSRSKLSCSPGNKTMSKKTEGKCDIKEPSNTLESNNDSSWKTIDKQSEKRGTDDISKLSCRSLKNKSLSKDDDNHSIAEPIEDDDCISDQTESYIAKPSSNPENITPSKEKDRKSDKKVTPNKTKLSLSPGKKSPLKKIRGKCDENESANTLELIQSPINNESSLKTADDQCETVETINALKLNDKSKSPLKENDNNYNIKKPMEDEQKEKPAQTQDEDINHKTNNLLMHLKLNPDSVNGFGVNCNNDAVLTRKQKSKGIYKNSENMKAINKIKEEFKLLSGYAIKAFELMPFEAKNFYEANLYKNENFTNRFLTNREILSLQDICLFSPENPNVELFYEILVMLLRSRKTVLLIPDEECLLKVTENIRKEYIRSKKKRISHDFLIKNWDLNGIYCRSDVWSLTLNMNKEVKKLYCGNITVGHILSFFCSWRNNKCTQNLTSIHLRNQMKDICPEADLNNIDILGLCLKLYAAYCDFIMGENEINICEQFINQKFQGTSTPVSKEDLIENMKSSVSLAPYIQKTEKREDSNKDEISVAHLESRVIKLREHLNEIKNSQKNLQENVKFYKEKKAKLLSALNSSEMQSLTTELSKTMEAVLKTRTVIKRKTEEHHDCPPSKKMKETDDFITGTSSSSFNTIYKKDDMKKVVIQLLKSNISMDKIPKVIQTIMENIVGEANIVLPGPQWIRIIAKQEGIVIME